MFRWQQFFWLLFCIEVVRLGCFILIVMESFFESMDVGLGIGLEGIEIKMCWVDVQVEMIGIDGCDGGVICVVIDGFELYDVVSVEEYY